MLQISEQATDVLERAHEAASRFDPDARVRIYRRGDVIETGFAHEPFPGDQVVEHAGLTLFVEEGIAGVLDTSAEHDHLLVRP
jgi:hypothetical protein